MLKSSGRVSSPSQVSRARRLYIGANHHTPEFDVDERGMIYGVAAALGYVKDFLNYDKEIPFKPFEGTLKNLVERNL